MAGAAQEASPERSGEGRRRLITMDAGCFCVAGATLWAHQLHFAWQALHFEHISWSLNLYFVPITVRHGYRTSSSVPGAEAIGVDSSGLLSDSWNVQGLYLTAFRLDKGLDVSSFWEQVRRARCASFCLSHFACTCECCEDPLWPLLDIPHDLVWRCPCRTVCSAQGHRSLFCAHFGIRTHRFAIDR